MYLHVSGLAAPRVGRNPKYIEAGLLGIARKHAGTAAAESIALDCALALSFVAQSKDVICHLCVAHSAHRFDTFLPLRDEYTLDLACIVDPADIQQHVEWLPRG